MGTTTEFHTVLGNWFDRRRRQLPWRDTRDPYLIWVSEVMLQQTQVATVIPYYSRFTEVFPTVRGLSEATEQSVLKQWEGLGYYARARNLHKAARVIMAAHGGTIPSDYRAFRALPGVGDYIAAAVLSIGFGQPYPVVDGNVKRVIARVKRVDKPVNHASAVKYFVPIVAAMLDTENPGRFNQAVMELGALVCTPRNPDCRRCPVASHCDAHANDDVSSFPKKQKRKPVPTHRIAVGVVWKDERVLVTRRQSGGLLGGLWEFPGGKIEPGESPEAACEREISEEVGLGVQVLRHLTQVKHAYTHFKIVMEVFECRYLFGDVTLCGPVDYQWIGIGALHTLPFPKANNKFIPLLLRRDS